MLRRRRVKGMASAIPKEPGRRPFRPAGGWRGAEGATTELPSVRPDRHGALRYYVPKKSTKLAPLRERPDLDFSKGVRGKYYQRMQEGTNIVLLAPDLMDAFPDSDAVNDALRKYQGLTTPKRA